MIQDILPKHFTNHYMEKSPGKESKIIGFRENLIFFREKEKKLEYLTYQDFTIICHELQKEVPFCRYLFSIDDEDYFLADVSFLENWNGFSFHRMFEIRSMRPMDAMLAGATAYHLYVWYRDNRFCGRCGAPLIHKKEMRALECEKCHNLVFPKIAPAVIVAVTDGNRILMTKYAGREYKRYALIAGFTEIGETAEQTVMREVMEEVGVKVKNIRYYKSQPWGFDSNLLLGYFAELDGDDTISMDEEELSVAEWVHYKDVPADSEGISLTREMMTKFRTEKEKEA